MDRTCRSAGPLVRPTETLGASTRTEERTLGVQTESHRDYQLVAVVLLLQCRRHRLAVT